MCFLSTDILAEETSKIGAELEFRAPAHLVVTGGMTAALPGIGYLPGWLADRFVSQYYIEKMYRHHLKMCRASGNCKVERTKWRSHKEWLRGGGYRITYNDGFWFELTKDPHVVEVIAKPMSLEGWKEQAPRLQRDLFDVAKMAGMAPPTIFSGGHMSFGLQETFAGDDVLFRNFLVDFANHSELTSGILKNDPINAKALAADPKKMKAFQEVIADFDAGKIKGIHDLAKAIHERVNGGEEKADAISLYTIVDGTPEDKQRLEIRGLRAQKTADHFVLQGSLFYDRLKFLKGQGGRVPLLVQKPIKDEVQGAENFYKYLTESGHRWEDHAPFLPARYTRLTQSSPGVFSGEKRSFIGRCVDQIAILGGL